MTFRRNQFPIVSNYTLYDSLLSYVGSMVNDLGITLDRNLTFYYHIEKSCCKDLKTLGFIKSVFLEFNLISPLKTLFCALVRSILEYDVVIWDSSTASSRNQLESIQRTFLSFAAMVLHIDH